MGKAKKLPYGVNDFYLVRNQDMYYVDKSMYLFKMEDVGHFLFFIRPRRFGKSLLISMMRAYYDKRMADRFQELFGDLWIGQHPTEAQGRYQVMYFDFSRISGDTDTLEEDFNSYCSIQVDGFMSLYRDDYDDVTLQEVKKAANVQEKLNIINFYAQNHNIPLYLIVDEYDNFTNVVLNKHGEEAYHAITHADGFYRGVFKLFKGMFERIFLIGVSPVTLDDLTSGFNIALNISTDYRFNDMLGFTTEDVREMLTYYKDCGCLPDGFDVEATLELMKPWYDNYCFAKQQLLKESRVFNPDMTLRYISTYVGTGMPPEHMLDPNTMTDYNKMRKLLMLDSAMGERGGILRRIAGDGQIVAAVEESFPAIKLIDPNMFVSLLFYYGMLTIKDSYGDMLLLGIPNNNVLKQYYSFLLEYYDGTRNLNVTELNQLFPGLAFNGQWEEPLRFIAKAYYDFSSVRDAMEGERNLQGFFLAYLTLTNMYLTAPELELNHGYCDFFLLPDTVRYKIGHSYIIELKYLPKKDFAARAEAQWQEAVEQIQRYAAAPRVEQLRAGTQLHKIIMQFEGCELRRIEEI